MGKEIYLDKKAITEQLTKELFNHRQKLGLMQREVAEFLDRSEKTYQHWESTGEGLSNIFTILQLFQALEFSTAEIIGVLGLPPLTADELKDICPDGDTLKSIQENGICSYVRMNCGKMDYCQIERLFDVLCDERSERRKRRRNN